MLTELNRIAKGFAENPTIKANATISFDVITNQTTFTEDDWGNPIPEEEKTRTIILECYLKERPLSKSDIEMIAGIDQNCTFFKGRLVNPIEYTMPIKATTPLTVTINDRVGTAIGDLRLFESPFSQQENIKNVLGQRVAVIVQFTQGE
jgi:hypothetical protein